MIEFLGRISQTEVTVSVIRPRSKPHVISHRVLLQTLGMLFLAVSACMCAFVDMTARELHDRIE